MSRHQQVPQETAGVSGIASASTRDKRKRSNQDVVSPTVRITSPCQVETRQQEHSLIELFSAFSSPDDDEQRTKEFLIGLLRQYRTEIDRNIVLLDE